MSILTKLCRDLPDDPARAIVAFANNVRRDLIEVGNWREVDPENFTAVINFIVEFCKRYSLPIDLSISRSGGQSEYGFMTAYVDKVLSSRKRLFEREVADEVNKMILEYDNRSSVESF